MLSLPRGTKMFQFPRLPPSLTTGSLPITEAGLPHSGISGSRPARGSPERIVVRHALRRLLAPRHPPVAYSSLTIPPPEPAGGQQSAVSSQSCDRLPVAAAFHQTCFLRGRPYLGDNCSSSKALHYHPSSTLQFSKSPGQEGVQVFGCSVFRGPVVRSDCLHPTAYCLPIRAGSLTTE